MLILNKEFRTIQAKAEEKLEEYGINNNPGSIARLFLSIINEEQAEFYDMLTIYHAQCFVSTATGNFLDEIGALLNCSRNYGEEDDDYRYRITNQVLSSASSNYTAIRLAALSVDGVNDVAFYNFSHGIGSFEVFILNDKNTIDEATILEVANKINEVVGFGIKFTVSMPLFKEIKLAVKLIFAETVSQSSIEEIKIMARKEITNYIENLQMGEQFIINELTQRIMQINDDIINYSILSFKIDDYEVMHTDQYCDVTEKFILSSTKDSIQIS